MKFAQKLFRILLAALMLSIPLSAAATAAERLRLYG